MIKESKAEFLLAIDDMQDRIEKADPHIRPQLHGINEGKVLDTRRVLETAHWMLTAAKTWVKQGNLEKANDYLNLAAGMAMVHGVIFGDEDDAIPVPNVHYLQTKLM